MDPKDELLLLAVELNEVLSEYVEIQNEINSGQSSFFSFFKNTNFAKYYDLSAEIEMKLTDKMVEISEFEKSHSSDLSRPYLEYLKLLKEYSKELVGSATHLHVRQHLLYRKSEGNKIDKKRYKGVTQAFNQSLEKYSKLGDQLTEKTKELY